MQYPDRRTLMGPRPCALLVTLALATASLAAPGLLFRETMQGSMRWGEAGDSQDVTLHLTMEAADAGAFFADPRHRMQARGQVEVVDPEGTRLRYPISEGSFDFLAPGDAPGTRLMVYRLGFESWEGRAFWFTGVKTLRDDPGLDLLADTTVLASQVRRGAPDGPVVAEGTLRFRLDRPEVVASFLGSFRVPRAGFFARLRVLRRFASLYLGTLRDLYGQSERRRGLRALWRARR